MMYSGNVLRRWAAVCVLWGCAACGGSGAAGVDAGGVDAPTGPDAPSTSLTGMIIDRYITPDSEQSAPRDLSLDDSILAVSEADGVYSTHAGTGFQDGTFEIPNVRIGRVHLRVGGLHYTIDPAELDLGARVGRRASAVRLGDPAMIDASIGGLSPWADGHEVEIWAPWVDGHVMLPLLDQPSTDSTRLSSLFDYTAMLRNVTGDNPFLIEAEQGDRMYMAQLVPRDLDSGLGTYHTVERVYQPDPFTLSTEQTTRLRGDFTAVAQSEGLTVDWRGAAFDSLTAAMLPPGSTASLTKRDLWVRASPLPLSSGAMLRSRGTLVGADLTEVGDAALAMSYGNPYPADWELAAEIEVMAGRRYQGAGGTSVFLPAYYRAGMAIAEVAAAPVEPAIGPVQSPRIDGKDALSPQLGFADAPELTWDAPAQGSAHFYEVDVFRLDGNYGAHLATVRTTETSVVLPPDLFGLSEQYVFRIRAHFSPNHPIWGPAGSYYPYAMSSMLTEVIRR